MGNSAPFSRRLAWSMLALGRRPMPESIALSGQIYFHRQTVKHDFWAATGFYESDFGQRIVVKLARTADFYGIPMSWSGRFLGGREARFYRRLRNHPNVPRLLATVGDTGLVHEFVPGRPLSENAGVPPRFFDELQQLMDDLHARGMAYVDTNKSVNVLVGEDGRPHLIDFQISWDIHDLGDNFLNHWWLRRLQRADRYHLLKHKRRLCPQNMTAEEQEIVARPGRLIRIHRFVTKPYFLLRRATIRRWRNTGRVMPETMA